MMRKVQHEVAAPAASDVSEHASEHGSEHASEHAGGHVIVCGLHGVGLRVVEQFRASGIETVVVDDVPDARLVDTVTQWGVPHLSGDPRLARTLHAAGLDRARALVAAETDDLVTLATALLARQLRPDLTIVVHMRNPSVGRALADLDITVVDVAAVAAPSVVEACLGTGAHAMTVGGHPFVLARVVADEPGTLRELYGDLAPLAVVMAPGPHERVIFSPPRDTRVDVGDRVSLFGTEEEILAQGVSSQRVRDARSAAESAPVGARYPHPPRERPASAAPSILRSLVEMTDRRLRAALVALAALVAVSTTVLVRGYEEADGTRMSVLDALYFTIETVATVGYGDFSFREQSVWLRVWAISLMVLGAGLVSLVFALLTNLLVSRQLDEVLGRRRLTRFHQHVIVAGLGAVGVRVVEALRAGGTDVVVIDPDPANPFLARMHELGVPVVAEDGTLPQTLDQVQLGDARAVAVLTSDDLTNLEIGLAVRQHVEGARPEMPVILRLFDRSLADAVSRGFGFRHTRSTAALAAPWFVGPALGLDVQGTFYAAGETMLLARIAVEPGAGLDGVALRDLDASARVLAIRRDGVLDHRARRDTLLAGGDDAWVVGRYEELLRLLRQGRVHSA